ncbi:TPA: hypothetical protein DDZ86_04000 [Candidatus Dependentiae bacterium]|nr:MAG: Protease Do [candidate division TM6 bacterium GW2011_GWF2_43_87]HBL98778.1 hypothetical protein [Candidatus Dependentiae bacterium]
MRNVRFVVVVLMVLGAGYGAMRWYRETQKGTVLVEKMKSDLETLRKHIATPEAPGANGKTGPECVCAAPANPWEWVHSIVRNMVAQVFVFRTEFNWTEPYKTPVQNVATGSAFFIDKTGLLMTNAHVVDQAQHMYIQISFFGKRRFDVTIVGVCPDRDLALIKISPEDLKVIIDGLGALPVLEFGDSDKIKRADEILTLGYPLGQQSLKSTMGIVSGRQHMSGSFMIQIDAPINPGNSGGPSLDRSGKVIGINTSAIFGDGTQNVGYIVPSNEVKLFLKQLNAAPELHGIKFLRKPFLGFLFNDASEEMTRYLGNPVPGGMYVLGNMPKSPIEKAGFKPGDMIYEIDGHRVDYFGEVQVEWSEDRVSVVDYASRLMPGDLVHMIMYRKGTRHEMVAKTSFSDELPVRVRYADYEDIDYEVIGGMVVMELALNHIPILSKVNPRLERYLDLESQFAPRLIITHVLPNSEAIKARTVHAGSIIDEVNGTPVKTLDEFRKAVRAGRSSGYLTMKLDGDILSGVFAVLSLKKIIDDEPRLAATYFYTITSFMERLRRG